MGIGIFRQAFFGLIPINESTYRNYSHYQLTMFSEKLKLLILFN